MTTSLSENYPLRAGLPPLPRRMSALPRDHRGYPVPFFVSWIDGKPEFRAADGDKLVRCVREKRCWVCGDVMGVYKTFVIGPMCAVNRISSEPPCHKDCAEFSAVACPFLTLPRAVRRTANMPEGMGQPAGHMIERNPGVTMLWTTESYKLVRAGRGGLLFHIGDPRSIAWYSQGRTATREEVLQSIRTGLPILQKMADDEGPHATEKLAKQHTAALELVPA